MPKRIIWKQTILAVDKLADWLTAHNFQTNKFKICYLEENIVLVLWIHKELPNIE